jgi:hypothetical protein
MLFEQAMMEKYDIPLEIIVLGHRFLSPARLERLSDLLHRFLGHCSMFTGVYVTLIHTILYVLLLMQPIMNHEILTRGKKLPMFLG